MSFAFTVITAASLHLNKLNCSKWMILFPSVALLPNFWYNLTQDKTLIAAPDAPGNSSTRTQKSSTKKRLSPTTTSIFYFCQFIMKHKTHICTSRSRPSPRKEVAKKLFTGEETADGSGSSDSGAATSSQNRYLASYFHQGPACNKSEYSLPTGIIVPFMLSNKFSLYKCKVIQPSF